MRIVSKAAIVPTVLVGLWCPALSTPPRVAAAGNPEVSGHQWKLGDTPHSRYGDIITFEDLGTDRSRKEILDEGGVKAGKTTSTDPSTTVFCYDDVQIFEVAVLTDFYPKQNRWSLEIQNESNLKWVEENRNDLFGRNQLFEDQICLLCDTDYRWTLVDTARNGMCNAGLPVDTCGSYSISLGGVELAAARGDSFDDSVVQLFRSDPCPPSSFPSLSPSDKPSESLNDATSNKPSDTPSHSPSISATPTDTPSYAPSVIPSKSRTDPPSVSPSGTPSNSPSAVPTDIPSNEPSLSQSFSPSVSPSAVPSDIPSKEPSDSPSSSPSDLPSRLPSHDPSSTPNVSPSHTPSNSPSGIPSKKPSSSPSDQQTVCADEPGLFTILLATGGESLTCEDLEDFLNAGSIDLFQLQAVCTFDILESGDKVYTKCKALCGQVSEGPCAASASPSDLPSASPSAGPSSLPSNAPSGLPSVSPSDDPSVSPSNS